jgi:hypothetical protein
VSRVAAFIGNRDIQEEKETMELSFEEMDLEQSEYLPNREVMCSPCYNPCYNPCYPTVTLSVHVCLSICL